MSERHSWFRCFVVLIVVAVLATACRASTQTTLLIDTSEMQQDDDTAPSLADTGPEFEGERPDKERPNPENTGAEDSDGTAASTAGSGEARLSPLDDPPDTPPSDNPFSDPVNGGGVDFMLTRDDVDCDEDTLNEYPDTPFVVAHVVVDGNLGAPCFGTQDERLIVAWQVLASITPPGQLADLGLFGGYVSTEPGETTLAFVNTLDFEGSLYQMSINLDEAEADPDELMLTMAHEFTHIFSSLSTQIDRFAVPEECSTYDNGEGCYRDDSLMWEWIQLFWDDGLIDQIDPSTEPTGAQGQERCNFNSGFLGSYAASNPEEDFAESFSAFVFRLEVDSDELRAKMEWFARQPGLVEFRNLAIEAELGPLRNFFERCG